MARGRDKHEAHKQELAALGRPLSRRARSHCELCGESGTLRVVEVPGGPAEPEEDWALLLCPRCQELQGAKTLDASTLRFLETSVWAELRPAQITSVRLLRVLQSAGAAWAGDTLENLYLDPDVEELI